MKIDKGQRSQKTARGFTLIELLVVISIIGLLAGLTIGISSVASNRKKIDVTKVKLRQMEVALDDYKASIGSYPPDSESPIINQLFYELGGTIYQGRRYIPNLGGEGVNRETCRKFFGVDGIQNTAMETTKTKSFLNNFESSNFATLTNMGMIKILVSPVKWPSSEMIGNDLSGRALESYRPIRSNNRALHILNPFQYRSSGRDLFNEASFDLWVDVPIGRGEIIRINNWNREEIGL